MLHALAASALTLALAGCQPEWEEASPDTWRGCAREPRDVCRGHGTPPESCLVLLGGGLRDQPHQSVHHRLHPGHHQRVDPGPHVPEVHLRLELGGLYEHQVGEGRVHQQTRAREHKVPGPSPDELAQPFSVKPRNLHGGEATNERPCIIVRWRGHRTPSPDGAIAA